MSQFDQIIFETKRLVVRPYTLDDRENFFLMNGDEEVVRYIRPAKTKDESDIFLKEVIAYSQENPLYGRWAVNGKESGEFVGSFAIIPVEKTDNMQLGYSLLKSCWGMGYATELTLSGLQYVFSKTDLSEIFGITEAANTGSQKVLKKAGFTFEKSCQEGNKIIFYFIAKKSSK